MLDKRAGQLRIVSRVPSSSPVEWQIRLEDPSGGQYYVLGYIQIIQDRPIGRGSQGIAYLGTYAGYNNPVNSANLMQIYQNCPEEASIKIPAGRDGYRSAGLIKYIASEFIVKVMGYGIERTAPQIIRGQQITEDSIVAFERLGKYGRQMISQYSDFDPAPLFRAMMQGLTDTLDVGYVNMYMKLDTIMIQNPLNRMAHAVWKIIDFDLMIPKSTVPVYTGKYIGTARYAAPGKNMISL